MMENKKVICLTLGCNEHAVLEYLDGFEGAVSFEDIYEAHKDNISLAYTVLLAQLLDRLLKKKMVLFTYWRGILYYQISNKGRLMLEVFKA